MNTTNKDIELSNLIRYDESLANLAVNKSPVKFPNKDPKHAAIALVNILKYSHKDFIIFDDNLEGDIVKNTEVVSFKDALKRFLRKGGKAIFVIHEKESEKDDIELIAFLKSLTEVYPETMIIKKASADFISEMEKKNGEDVNTAIGDNRMYRIEKGNRNNKTREATVCFNDEKVVKELLIVFNTYINSFDDYFIKQ
jgi:hypothetical protein